MDQLFCAWIYDPGAKCTGYKSEQKKKGSSVTDNTDQENNLVRYYISGFKYRGETYVQTNFEFSGLYDEIWPIKLTDHSKFTNWEIHG